MVRKKPKILLDIKHNPRMDLFERRPQRLNLSFKLKSGSSNKFVWYSPKSIASIVAFMLAFYFGAPAFAPIITTDTLAQTTNSLEEQRILQQQLDIYEQEINALEAQISESRKRGTSLKGEINTLNAKVAKINLQIKAVNLSISKLNQEVTQTAAEIHETENYISSNKNTLADTLANIYYTDKTDTIEMLLKSNELSDFFGSINDLSSVQDNLRGALQELIVARNELIEEKDKLDLAKADKEAVKAYQDSQRLLVQKIRAEKDS